MSNGTGDHWRPALVFDIGTHCIRCGYQNGNAEVPKLTIACFGRSGHQFSVFCTTRKVSCFESSGMLVGRSKALMKIASSVHVVELGCAGL